jgi:hypothetical protein
MEYPQDSITNEQYEELKKVASSNICAVCQGELTVHTDPDRKTIGVGCLTKDHHGFVGRETLTESFRRGATLPEIIERHIHRRMMPADVSRSMALVHVKYPDTLRDQPTAALFILDCMRLGLDPLISPPEVVPAVFNKKQRDGSFVPVVTEIITVDGYLSGAARSDPQEWDGPPAAMPLQDYLMSLEQHKGRSLEDIEKIAKRQALDLCGDADAWVWVALGKRKSGSNADSPAYGWYTRAEQQEDRGKRLVAGDLPGNQARVRAIKRWTRETFPEWRQKMIDMTSEWVGRAEGVKEAQKIIDVEYRLAGPAGSAGGIKRTDSQGKASSASSKDPIVTEPIVEKTPPVDQPPTADQAFENLESAGTKKQEHPSESVSKAGPGGLDKTISGVDSVIEHDIPDAQALFQACFLFWKMQPPEVSKELGYNSQMDLKKDPKFKAYEGFKTIKATRVSS